MRLFIILIILWVVSIGNTADAQEQRKWSLEDCINYAYENNIQLKQSLLRAAVVVNNAKQARHERLPNFNGSSSFNRNFGRSVNYVDNTYVNRSTSSLNYGLSSSVDLFDGFKKKNTIERNEFNLQAVLFDIEKAKENLALNVTSFYLSILYNKEQLQVAKDRIAVTQQQIERAKALVEAGKLPKGDLLEQESLLAQEELQLVEAENRLTLSFLDLYQLLDITTTNNFPIEEPELDIDEETQKLISFSHLYENIIEERPSVKAYEYRLKSAEKEREITKGSQYPSLSMRGGLSSGYSNQSFENMEFDTDGNLVGRDKVGFRDQLTDNLNKSFGFNLSIPIFNQFRVKTAIANAELDIENSELELQNQKNLLYKEIQQAYINASAAIRKYVSSEKSLEASKETFRYVEEKYALGMISTFDYNEAKNNLARSKSNLIQAKYDYIFRIKILDFYNGVPLTL